MLDLRLNSALSFCCAAARCFARAHYRRRLPSQDPRTVLREKKQFRNGMPKATPYKSYSVNNPDPRRQVFAFGDYQTLQPLDPRTPEEWNALAIPAELLKPGQTLQDFQVEAANHKYYWAYR